MSEAALSGDVKAYISKIEQENKSLKESLHNNIISYEKKVKELENENMLLEEKLRLALFRRFGKATEKFIGKGQIPLFESAEQKPPEEAEDKKVTVKSYNRSPKGRKPIDEKIPRVVEIIDIKEEDKHCACGYDLVYIGEDVTERLVIIPEQVYVLQYHIKKYACKNCEGSGDEEKKAVRTGKVPANIMSGSIATPALLSYILVKKYADSLPFYRQEAGFGRIGVDISRQDMSNWQMKGYKKILPLLELLKNHIKSGEVIQMDETPMEVMEKAEGKRAAHNAYMWLAKGGPPGKPVVWYEYNENRASENVIPFLKGFSGYLQTDGWSSYNTALKQYPHVVHVGCFAHVRRRFFEAMKVAQGAGNTSGGTAAEALSYIKGLYTVEQDLREKEKLLLITKGELLEERQWRCNPILKGFNKWLEKQSEEILPTSELGKAIKYARNQWPTLIHYLDHEELTPDNNGAERAVRPFVIGRKNWVMSGSPEGARSSCAFFTLIESAKANKRNPYEYLKGVFEWAADNGETGNWEHVLPWNFN
jgi:transposase